MEIDSTIINKLINEEKERFIQDTINEAKEVLAMLGAASYEFQDIYDIEVLHRLMTYKYESKLLDVGIPIEVIKGIYNTRGKTLYEKADSIQKLYNEAINKTK